MNQQKTGAFLKELRKRKGLTQEQLAEHFYVSSRTVSRWETGSNLPDLDMLIELADFYDVDIREIIDGEKKGENMDHETKDTLKKVAAYATKREKRIQSKVVHLVLGIGLIVLFLMLLARLEHDGMLGDLAPAICILLGIVTMGGGIIAVFCFWLPAFREEPSDEPERTVTATVVSKEVLEGTHRTGRSMMGFSFLINFQTEDGQNLPLYAYEIEFGGLKEGMTGILTYQGRYFVYFQITE